jgi:hypothetical protein
MIVLCNITHRMFVLTLKRDVLPSGYMAEFSLGRPQCSGRMATMKFAGLSNSCHKIVLALSESTELQSSLPSVVGQVNAGGLCVSALGVDWC